MPSLRARRSALCLSATSLRTFFVVLALCALSITSLRRAPADEFSAALSIPRVRFSPAAKVTRRMTLPASRMMCSAVTAAIMSSRICQSGTYSLAFDLTGFKKSCATPLRST